MKETLHFEYTLGPTEIETILRDAITALPDASASPQNDFTHYAEVIDCARRRVALLRLLEQEEKALRKAAAALNREIFKTWKPGEVPRSTISVMNVWAPVPAAHVEQAP